MSTTENYRHAQEEAAFWQRCVRSMEDKYPQVYQHLEHAAIAAGGSVTLDMTRHVMYHHYWSQFLPVGSPAREAGLRLNEAAFWQLCDADRFSEATASVYTYYQWRLTQQLVAFDPDIAGELAWWPQSSDVRLLDNADDAIPTDPLFRLPFYSFVAVPGIDDADNPVSGLKSVLVSVLTPRDVPEQFANQSEQILTLALKIRWQRDPKPGTELQVVPFVLDNVRPGMTIDEAIEKTAGNTGWDDRYPVKNAVIRVILPFLLYLCAENRELDGDIAPAPAVTRTKRGLRLFPAARIALATAGVRIGAALRQHHARSDAAGGELSGSVRPHLRASHWHKYYKGSRANPAARTAVLHFLPPIPVNAHLGAIEATIRPVQAGNAAAIRG